MVYYFLPKDYDALDQKIDELNALLQTAGDEKGLMASQASETWHDNFGFEAQERHQEMISRRIDGFAEMKNAAEIVERHLPDEAGVGASVKIEVEDGETRHFIISSYQVLDQQDETEVSYAAPLAEPFLGTRVGDVREVQIGDETKHYRVTAIE